MNITGIITEYNPFHNGHLYHLTQAKKNTNADGIVCIMSGNFIQRGGPAILDKWNRTNMALENGVDLIIELPSYYAVSSAEFFAKGSVSILHNLGVVNSIFFGSECGDIDRLNKISNILADEDAVFKSIIKKFINNGLTFAKAREKALIEFLGDSTIENIISSSNNILGIEYIKALIRLNSSITPTTLRREGSSYNEKKLKDSFSSATAIRETLKKGSSLLELQNSMPFRSYELFSKLQESNFPFVFEDQMYSFIKYKLLTNCINFNNLSEVKEGLNNKFIKEILNSKNFDDLILRVKSKRYTYSKISRILTQIFIGFDTYDLNSIDMSKHLYARVLGFNSKGKNILSLIKKNSSIPIISKVPKHFDNPLLELDLLSTRAYSILNSKVDPRSDYLISPIIKH